MIAGSVERRRREREAPLLRAQVPGLVGLSIEVRECGQGAGMPDIAYVRRFVLATAPALVLFACGEPLCEGGGYDLSPAMMPALGAHTCELRGVVSCAGTVGDEGCTRCLRYAMTATFEDAPSCAPTARSGLRELITSVDREG